MNLFCFYKIKFLWKFFFDPIWMFFNLSILLGCFLDIICCNSLRIFRFIDLSFCLACLGLFVSLFFLLLRFLRWCRYWLLYLRNNLWKLWSSKRSCLVIWSNFSSRLSSTLANLFGTFRNLNFFNNLLDKIALVSWCHLRNFWEKILSKSFKFCVTIIHHNFESHNSFNQSIFLFTSHLFA